jgi:hypothetical protein
VVSLSFLLGILGTGELTLLAWLGCEHRFIECYSSVLTCRPFILIHSRGAPQLITMPSPPPPTPGPSVRTANTSHRHG